MHLKTGLYILSCSVVLSLTSCLGSDDPLEITVPDDAELLSFGLSHDSITELATTVFSIDQAKNLIYNQDSLTYLTDILKYESVVVKYTNSTGATNVLRVTAEGDSVKWVTSGDSLDIVQPIFLKVFSLVDTAKTKTYQVKINIHQVDPDSVQYTRIVESEAFLNKDIKTIRHEGTFYLYAKEGASIAIYQSTNAKDWTPTAGNNLPADLVVSGIQTGSAGVYAFAGNGDFYFSPNALDWVKRDTEHPVQSILGFLGGSEIYKPGISFIVKKEDKNVFAFSPDLLEWEYGNEVGSDFPLSGFSVINDTLRHTLTLVGGITASGKLNTVWSTENGLYWSERSVQEGRFPLLEGANAFLYNNEFYLLNGKLPDGTYNKKVYFSIDGGTSWKEKPAKYQPLENYPFRQNASLVVDKDGKYFYIIGGESGTILTDIWQAFLNKKTFDY